MITALIPIKRNSQRIPNKNFLEINSKPLFFWIIDSLLNSEFVDEIVINYDDDYILQEVSKYFDSIKFCKRYQNKIGIKIVDSGSPIFCKTLNKVLFRKDCICGKFIDISATLIRKTKKTKLKKLLKISHDK